MTKTKQEIQTDPVVREFFAVHWPQEVQSLEQTYRLSVDEAARLYHSKIARLIGALPHLARVFAPQRTAIAHLSVFLTANRGARRIFDHNQDDDVEHRTRLLPISHFIGGNQLVINRGMKLLELTMMRGYLNDMEKDRASGEYNPYNAGTWDPAEVDLMIERLQSDPDPVMDQVYSISDAMERNSFWMV